MKLFDLWYLRKKLKQMSRILALHKAHKLRLQRRIANQRKALSEVYESLEGYQRREHKWAELYRKTKEENNK